MRRLKFVGPVNFFPQTSSNIIASAVAGISHPKLTVSWVTTVVYLKLDGILVSVTSPNITFTLEYSCSRRSAVKALGSWATE